jgi:glycosyltransferase involved in cell wall biosynthesis
MHQQDVLSRGAMIQTAPLPSVSVVIPTKNRHAYLREAVASALRQTHAPNEILVVDDGAGAASALVDFPRLVQVLDNAGRGPVPARNLAVSHASSACIAFLDDDDWFSDGQHLERAAAEIAGGAKFCFADGTLVFDDGSADVAFTFTTDAKSLEANNTILISAVTYVRSLHHKLGNFDESLPYYWDWDWYLRVARSGARFCHCASPSVNIRVHAANMSGPAQEAARRANLDRFSAKHGLPAIPLKNHLSLARGG